MKPATWVSLLLLAAAPIAAAAGGHSGKRFDSHDWTLACDNTRTCRAAGYSSNDSEAGVSVLLTRVGGGDSTVNAAVRFTETTISPHLRIGKIDNGQLTYRTQDDAWHLNDAQTQALLPALLALTGQIEFSDGHKRYPLSTRGANAVLLKMDDWQGRIGTPSALVRKGNQDNSSVPAPLPLANVVYQKPAIQAAWTEQVQAISLPALRSELIRQYGPQLSQDCPNLPLAADADDKLALHVTPLSATNSVATGLCWRAAYNEGYGVWLINNRPPFQATLITTDASSYENGMIKSAQKGRGVGDCWWHQTLVWNGKRFALAQDFGTGLCRGFFGGAWTLPTWVSTFPVPY